MRLDLAAAVRVDILRRIDRAGTAAKPHTVLATRPVMPPHTARSRPRSASAIRGPPKKPCVRTLASCNSSSSSTPSRGRKRASDTGRGCVSGKAADGKAYDRGMCANGALTADGADFVGALERRFCEEAHLNLAHRRHAHHTFGFSPEARIATLLIRPEIQMPPAVLIESETAHGILYTQSKVRITV